MRVLVLSAIFCLFISSIPSTEGMLEGLPTIKNFQGRAMINSTSDQILEFISSTFSNYQGDVIIKSAHFRSFIRRRKVYHLGDSMNKCETVKDDYFNCLGEKMATHSDCKTCVGDLEKGSGVQG